MSDRQSLGCARCGSCCDPVILTQEMADVLAAWADAEHIPDPQIDENWAVWREIGWTDDRRESAIFHYHTDHGNRASAEFTAKHWHSRDDPPEDMKAFDCDQFDPDTRLCRAGNARPPVCKGFPWYGNAPSRDRAVGLDKRCSYLLDVPPQDRPEGAWPLIPIEVIKR